MSSHTRSSRRLTDIEAESSEPAWMHQLLLHGIGLAICISLWIPGDSVAVQEGSTLPQVGLWFLLGLLAYWQLTYRRSSQWREVLKPHGWKLGTTAALLFWLALVIGTLPGRGNLHVAIPVAWQWVGSLGLPFLLTMGFRGRHERGWVASLLLGLVVSLLVHALYQYFISMPLTRAEFESDPVGSLAKLGRFAPPGSDIYLQYQSRLESTEPLGPFALTNSLAGLLVFSTTMTLGLLLERGKHRDAAWWVLAMILVLELSCLILTKSRGGWLALLMAGGGYIGWQVWSSDQGKRHRQWLWGVVGLFAIVVLVQWIVDPLVLYEAPKSLAFRWQYWEASFRLMADHLAMGIGPGNFQNRYPLYKAAEASETIADPHSFLIEIAATVGLPGLLLSLAWIGSWIGFSLRRVKHLVPREEPQTDANSPLVEEPVLESQDMVRQWIRKGGSFVLVPLLAGVVVWGVPELLGPAPDLLPYAIGLPLCMLVTAILIGGRVEASPMLWRWSVIGLTLHWCVNGGWLSPGNTVPWLIGLTFVATASLSRLEHPANGTSEPMPWLPKLSLGIGLLLLSGLFVWTAWLPYQRFRLWKETQYRDAQEWTERTEALRQMDRWNPAPSQAILDVKYQVARGLIGEGESTRRGRESRQEWEEALADLHERSPLSWQVWLSEARQRWGLYESPGDVEAILGAYREATRLYPSEVGMQIEFAACAHLLGREAEGKRAWERGMELERLTSHSNRKMKAVLVCIVTPRKTGLIGEAYPNFLRKLGEGETIGGVEGWHRAEPVAQYLRSYFSSDPALPVGN